MGYVLKVDERVLIPRPETELLVEEAVKLIDGSKSVLDLCTGSGAIAIAVKLKTDAKVFATDFSSDALTVAKENAQNLNAEIEFRQGDMFSALNKGEKFDVIISNPPYIKTADLSDLQAEVKFEPRLALDGGEDGLKFYRIIAENVNDFLTKNGVLIMECGDAQAESVKKLLSGFSSVEIIKDLENKDRIIKAVK